MNAAEQYLEALKSSRYRRVYALFFIQLGLFALSFAPAFAFVSSDGVCRTVLPNEYSGILSALVSSLPTVLCALALLLLSGSCYLRAAAYLLSLYRGFSLGGFISLASAGQINGLGGTWVWGAVFGFVECVLLFVLCALSDVYSEAYLTLRANGERGYSTSVFAELLRCALVLLGMMLVCRMLSVYLLLG